MRDLLLQRYKFTLFLSICHVLYIVSTSVVSVGLAHKLSCRWVQSATVREGELTTA